MIVGVGYSENPDTTSAGIQAAREALSANARNGLIVPCDLVLMFCTSRHDPAVLRDAVRSVLGPNVFITGGGAVGAMTGDRFGYAGDQVVLAAFWLEGVGCSVTSEGGMAHSEEETGVRLGLKLSGVDCKRDTPALLFYDAVDRTHGDVRLLMATPLLRGVEKGLGFLPRNLVGAGLQGDYTCSPTWQWVGHDLVQHNALALTFSRDVRIDNVILHGCRPATGYHTVTKAEDQVILEIDGQPAIPFFQELLGSGISPEEYAFFLILGINSGDKWGDFDENRYANRLCLAIDRKRDGIVMFESDMVPGTRFQIMHRSLDLEYMKPKIEKVFSDLGNRKPVFAFYIDCAGRAAGYAGLDLEDALVLQKTIGDRAPFMGIYSGVEIAPVSGVPRALDWTGVFCLFSVEA